VNVNAKNSENKANEGLVYARSPNFVLNGGELRGGDLSPAGFFPGNEQIRYAKWIRNFVTSNHSLQGLTHIYRLHIIWHGLYTRQQDKCL
jgi:hypothetical protein